MTILESISAPHRRESRSEYVLQHLIKLLVDRTLKPGDELPSESALAQRFNVSKPVIREALRQLVAMRVVDIRQGKPSIILPLSSQPLELFFRLAMHASDQGLSEAIELRTALEIYGVGLAAEHITAAEETNLAATLHTMEVSMESYAEWVAADVRFHMLLADAGKNGLLSFLIQALRGTMEETIGLLHAQRQLRDPKATLQRHLAIFEAVKAHDPEAARQAMLKHFEATRPVVQAIVAERRPPSTPTTKQ